MINCECGKPLYKLSQLIYVCHECGQLYEIQLRKLGRLAKKVDEK